MGNENDLSWVEICYHFPRKKQTNKRNKKKTKKQKKNSSLCIESYFYHSSIGHFGKYHNTLCLSPQILHEYCFQFLLELTVVPKENKNNTYAKIWEDKQRVLWYFSEMAYWSIVFSSADQSSVTSFVSSFVHVSSLVCPSIGLVCPCQPAVYFFKFYFWCFILARPKGKLENKYCYCSAASFHQTTVT